MNATRGEMLEAKLNSMSRPRDADRCQTEGERLEEVLWAQSVRAYSVHCGEEGRLELLEYHEGQAARLSNTLEALVRYHEAEAKKYRDGHFFA